MRSFSLPAHDGVLFDIGGGSVEFSFFENRTLQKVHTLDLGALRVSNDFLNEPQPSIEAVGAFLRRLRSKDAEESSEMPQLVSNGKLIGAGGYGPQPDQNRPRGMRKHKFGRLHGSIVRYTAL